MYYNVTVTYKHDQEVVHLAESTNLADIKCLAELICRNALPEVCSVRIDDGDGDLVYFWAATPRNQRDKALLQAPTNGRYIN
jgi:hypothetical protein